MVPIPAYPTITISWYRYEVRGYLINGDSNYLNNILLILQKKLPSSQRSSILVPFMKSHELLIICKT